MEQTTTQKQKNKNYGLREIPRTLAAELALTTPTPEYTGILGIETERFRENIRAFSLLRK